MDGDLKINVMFEIILQIISLLSCWLSQLLSTCDAIKFGELKSLIRPVEVTGSDIVKESDRENF